MFEHQYKYMKSNLNSELMSVYSSHAHRSCQNDP